MDNLDRIEKSIAIFLALILVLMSIVGYAFINADIRCASAGYTGGRIGLDLVIYCERTVMTIVPLSEIGK